MLMVHGFPEAWFTWSKQMAEFRCGQACPLLSCSPPCNNPAHLERQVKRNGHTAAMLC